jgi:dTDP-4-dehydrorhamnose reductase
MNRIYIAGCAGMLGDAFHSHFSVDHELRCTDIDVNEEWLAPLDVRDRDAYRRDVEQFEPEILFHLAAHTDLEYCERNPDDAYRTNALAVENAVEICQRLDIPLLYVSTAGIFDGRQDVYDDWATPSPLGHYARSKYAGELSVLQDTARYLICRPGWMMGGGPAKDKKFIAKVMKQLHDGAEELFIVEDKRGTPTYTHDFAANVRALLERELWGLYNMACQGVTSRLEVATELVSMLGLEKKIKVTRVSSAHFQQEYFAPRPASERLLNRKLELRGLNLMRDWRVALREYLRDYFEGYL